MASISGSDKSFQPFISPMLWRQLKKVLQFLNSNHYPHIPSPSSSKKRASVALIVRFRPSIAHPANFDSSKCGVSAGSTTQRVENFFSQPWVQNGEPEILFIKRAARAGDRWTSHIAFPGGGMEPLDADDCATSVRETQEEIGIDLSADHCTLIGNLPEQVVTTWWSKVPYETLFIGDSRIIADRYLKTHGSLPLCTLGNALRPSTNDLTASRSKVGTLGILASSTLSSSENFRAPRRIRSFFPSRY